MANNPEAWVCQFFDRYVQHRQKPEVQNALVSKWKRFSVENMSAYIPFYLLCLMRKETLMGGYYLLDLSRPFWLYFKTTFLLQA